MFRLGSRSLNNLRGVHPDLVNVVKRAIAITEVDFTVIEGLRTLQRQKVLLNKGKTWTMNSRHLTGHAVDIAPWGNGSISWDWKHFYPIADAMKAAAKELGVDLEWGGDWKKTKDGPHWQLSWNTYGKDDKQSKASPPKPKAKKKPVKKAEDIDLEAAAEDVMDELKDFNKQFKDD